MLKISKTAKISKLADIEDSIKGSLIEIGPNVMVDSFVKIKPAGGSGNLRIGENSNINSGTVVYLGNGVKIGKEVNIAANCTLAPTNHEIKDKNKLVREQRFMPSRGGIIIEDDVWIGANSVILDGAILRKGCVIGASSLVNGEVSEYSINVGNPLKTIGYRK